mmetsp:Transcript_2425/g.8661  ORF Transcript_2425/g.8661 Transcript_2425/m.8661 type:complete len:202 (+) Transcript_2425:811-1416(+)
MASISSTRTCRRFDFFFSRRRRSSTSFEVPPGDAGVTASDGLALRSLEGVRVRALPPGGASSMSLLRLICESDEACSRGLATLRRGFLNASGDLLRLMWSTDSLRTFRRLPLLEAFSRLAKEETAWSSWPWRRSFACVSSFVCLRASASAFSASTRRLRSFFTRSSRSTTFVFTSAESTNDCTDGSSLSSEMPSPCFMMSS